MNCPLTPVLLRALCSSGVGAQTTTLWLVLFSSILARALAAKSVNQSRFSLYYFTVSFQITLNVLHSLKQSVFQSLKPEKLKSVLLEQTICPNMADSQPRKDIS